MNADTCVSLKHLPWWWRTDPGPCPEWRAQQKKYERQTCWRRAILLKVKTLLEFINGLHFPSCILLSRNRIGNIHVKWDHIFSNEIWLEKESRAKSQVNGPSLPKRLLPGARCQHSPGLSWLMTVLKLLEVHREEEGIKKVCRAQGRQVWTWIYERPCQSFLISDSFVEQHTPPIILIL